MVGRLFSLPRTWSPLLKSSLIKDCAIVSACSPQLCIIIVPFEALLVLFEQLSQGEIEWPWVLQIVWIFTEMFRGFEKIPNQMTRFQRTYGFKFIFQTTTKAHLCHSWPPLSAVLLNGLKRCNLSSVRIWYLTRCWMTRHTVRSVGMDLDGCLKTCFSPSHGSHFHSSGSNLLFPIFLACGTSSLLC